MKGDAGPPTPPPRAERFIQVDARRSWFVRTPFFAPSAKLTGVAFSFERMRMLELGREEQESERAAILALDSVRVSRGGGPCAMS